MIVGGVIFGLHFFAACLYLFFMVETHTIQVHTEGNCDIVDITGDVETAIARCGMREGIVCLFNIGSTAGITTIEYEPGLVDHDIKAAFERIAPEHVRYEHEETWHDNNGHSHVRAALLGPSLSVPVEGGKLTLGTWQQIVLVDFDTRGRDRTIVCKMMGE